MYCYWFELPITGLLGLTIVDDNDISITLLVQNSPFCTICRKAFQTNVWIGQIHND